jgi:hypothetical protein
MKEKRLTDGPPVFVLNGGEEVEAEDEAEAEEDADGGEDGTDKEHLRRKTNDKMFCILTAAEKCLRDKSKSTALQQLVFT